MAVFGRRSNEQEQLRAGTSIIRISNQDDVDVEVQPGGETVVDMKDYFGWPSVQNVLEGYVRVYEPDDSANQIIASFGIKTKRPAQLSAGTYVLGDGKQEFVTFDINLGEEVGIDLERPSQCSERQTVLKVSVS